MEVIKNLVSSSKYGIKCPYEMNPTRIVVHNTYNDAPAKNEIAYMIRNNNEVSFHFAVDDQEVVQGIPLNRNAWHAGDGASGKGNREGIAIEICYSKSGGERFVNAEKRAAKFIAQLLKERNWDIDKVTKHQDYSNKYCPHRTLDMGWERFLNMIKAEIGTASSSPSKKSNETIVQEVINGAWGNGNERKERLTKAGYDYSVIQALVNQKLGAPAPKPKPSKKSNETIAQEVINGAGWVLFGKETNSKQLEVFNDLNKNLINLYRCVKYHPEALQKECEYLLNSRVLFEDFKAQMNVRGLTDIQRAARYLYLIKISFGADTRTYGTHSKSLNHALDMLDDISERLKKVVIENKSYDDLIKVYDRTGALFYIDPPYFNAERHYDELFSKDDHVHLRDILSNIRGKFILSYNDCKEVRELYKNFNIEEVERNNNLLKKSGRYKELIIRNFK